MKDDAEKSLPTKQDIILEVTLTPIQNTYYVGKHMLRVKQSKYERLDGSKSASHWAIAFDWFLQNTHQNFVMVLRKIAGAMGLDLPAADTYVIFDNDWNPQSRTVISLIYAK